MRFSAQKSILPILVCLSVAGCFKSSEERATEHLQRGIELAEAGDYDRAFVEFRNTLKFDADNLAVRREMAEIHLKRGAKAQAFRNYVTIAEAEPDNIDLRMLLSELAFSLGSWSEFTRHSEKALELNTATPPAPRLAALDLALRYRAASLDSDTPRKDALALEAVALDQAAPGNQILRKILIDDFAAKGRYGEALLKVEEAMASDPDDIQNYNGKLELLVRLERTDEIEAHLRDTIANFPDDTNAKRTLLRYLVSRGEVARAEDFLREVVADSPENRRDGAIGDLISFILQTRGPEAGLTEIDTVLATTPDDTFRVLRASMLYESGQKTEAISVLEGLTTAEETTLDPRELLEAKTLLARMLTREGNDVGARTLIEEVLAADPTAVGALKMQARWLIRSDQTDEAVISLRTALDNAPKDAEAMTLMAEAHQRAGKTDLMVSFLAQAAEATDNAPTETLRYARALAAQDQPLQAETALIASLRITPNDPDVLNQLGRIYLVMDDRPRAHQVVATLRKLEDEGAAANANAIELELVSREQGSEQALAYLEDLAAGDGDTASRAKLGVIRARLTSGDGAGALSYAEALLAEEPENIRYRYALALSHAAMRNYPEAVSRMQALLSDQPQLTQGWLQLSRIQITTGDMEGALATIDQGLEALPDSADLQWAKASFLQRGGDNEGAIEIFEALYARNSGSLVIANNLASMLTTYRSDPESLERASAIAARLAGTQVPALQDTYGWIQHLQGNHDEALRYLEPAAAALSRDVTVQVHLGMAYAGAGQTDQAIAQLRRALELGGPLGGNAQLMDQARAKIAELESPPAVQDATTTDQN